jgi:ABC-type transport system substrate-binding protein
VFSDVATNADGSPQVVLTDPMTLTNTMKRPWVVFPLYLAAQPGMMASPTWLAAADKDPTLEPKPVGTGPFIFKDYKPGESFDATKNPSYWNKPYPYLDEVEFRVIPDGKTRASALEAGDVNMIHTDDGENIAKFRSEADKFPMTEVSAFGETGYTLLKVDDRRRRCRLCECAARWRMRPTSRRSSTSSVPASTRLRAVRSHRPRSATCLTRATR